MKSTIECPCCYAMNEYDESEAEITCQNPNCAVLIEIDAPRARPLGVEHESPNWNPAKALAERGFARVNNPRSFKPESEA